MYISKRNTSERIRLAYNGQMINKKIEYVLERTIYSIDNSSKGQLLVTVEDLQGKNKSALTLGTSQLETYKIDTEKLYQYVYFQYISDNKLPKRMLTLNGSHIAFQFDYPKAQIKSLQFPCQTVSQEQTVIKQPNIERLSKKGYNELENIFETYKSKLQKLATSKLEQVDKRIENKLNMFNNKLQLDSQLTMQNITAFYSTIQQEHNSKFDGYVTSTIKKIQEINQLIVREHIMTFQKLEDKVIILNDNVKEFYDKLNDLTAVIDDNKTQQEDDARNLNISIDEKVADLKWRIKEVKEYLEARLDWIVKLNNLKEERPKVLQEKQEGYNLNQEYLFLDIDLLKDGLIILQMRQDVSLETKEVAKRRISSTVSAQNHYI